MTQEWPKEFDLNMEEELLEAWGVSDGIRELVANALDESELSGTTDPEIYQDEEGHWHIRDHGRGVTHQDLTQGEDEEKLNNPDQVIGKFGVGLKDALAVLYRHDVDVTIHSPYISFTVGQASKAGFDDVETLHAVIREPQRPDLNGTEVVLDGCSENDIEQAKQNFLAYTDATRLERTRFGDVLDPSGSEEAAVYVTGLKVASEERFLFSYDITNTTKNIRDALNRERSNVGRTAYTGRIKQILQACTSGDVAERLITDLQRYQEGTHHDELSWKPIQVHAAQVLNARDDVVFATPEERSNQRDLLRRASGDGHRVITVPSGTRSKLASTPDIEGEEIRDIDVYKREWKDSFEFNWVDESELSEQERANWECVDETLERVGVTNSVAEVRISETIRDLDDGWKAAGLWRENKNQIVIKRDVLESRDKFIGILLHEAAHARTGASDETREFEGGLTDFIGVLGAEALGEQERVDDEQHSPVTQI